MLRSFFVLQKPGILKKQIFAKRSNIAKAIKYLFIAIIIFFDFLIYVFSIC